MHGLEKRALEPDSSPEAWRSSIGAAKGSSGAAEGSSGAAKGFCKSVQTPEQKLLQKAPVHATFYSVSVSEPIPVRFGKKS